MIDKDSDDKISLDDIKSTFTDLNFKIEDSEIKEGMLNGSNDLDFNQFVTLLTSKFTGFSEESELRDAFATFVENESINSKTLRDCLSNTVSDKDEKEALSAVVEEFTKENKVTGVSKFMADEFIEKIK
ncbi:hypothetical protein CANINC_001588 [Pichia inconspicua]|uniref:EF-hand domain-containing protein n=1 Tax=Pichia inconspicua TaxID=52247 RepID=A0A4T0X3E0_9ASCO|nr:hypothetical protein CANINC_001588 [[Candida] inconspicua]